MDHLQVVARHLQQLVMDQNVQHHSATIQVKLYVSVMVQKYLHTVVVPYHVEPVHQNVARDTHINVHKVMQRDVPQTQQSVSINLELHKYYLDNVLFLAHHQARHQVPHPVVVLVNLILTTNALVVVLLAALIIDTP